MNTPLKLIYHGDCLDLLDELPRVPLVIADPPDCLGLAYDEYRDKMPIRDYYNFLELVIRKSLRVADTFWFSYYWERDVEVKHRIRNIVNLERPSVSVKTFIWRYTFGQYNDKDCGSGFRFLVRMSKPIASLNVNDIRIPSRRMELGDKRASGPKVPDDVWDFPRVVGNAKERRPWHPTQHPEALYERIIKLSSNPGDLVVDLFGGTGTLFRTAPALNRNALISEISKGYTLNIYREHEGSKVSDNAHQIYEWVSGAKA